MAAGFTARTSPASTWARGMPVSPDAPGETQHTSRRPSSAVRLSGAMPRVTSTPPAARGPSASAVTRRLPTPTTSTVPVSGSMARSSPATALT